MHRHAESLELARIRKSLGWTLERMAAELGEEYEFYKRLEYSRHKEPPPARIMARARHLQHGLTTVVREHAAPSYVVTVAIAAYQGVLAGNSFDEEAFYEREEQPTEIPSAFIVGGIDKIDMCELLRVSGNSMAPRIHSGDKVVIYKDPTPRPNTIVFAQSPDGRLYLKCLMYDDGRFVLQSYSANGIHVRDLTGWKIHGYAVAILGDPDSGSRNIEWNDGRPLKV